MSYFVLLVGHAAPTEEVFISMRSRGTFPAVGPDSVGLGYANSSLLGGLFMVDISICLLFVGMILTPFIVDSIHGPRPARVTTETIPEDAVRPSVHQPR